MGKMLNRKTEDTGGASHGPGSQNGLLNGSVTPVAPNTNTIVRVVEGLDELFLAVTGAADGQTRLPHQVPMRQRRLPPSFFRPPAVSHSRESSLDGGYQSNTTASTTGSTESTNGSGLVNYASSPLAIIHPRANSSPALLLSGLAASQPAAAFGNSGGIANRPTAEAAGRPLLGSNNSSNAPNTTSSTPNGGHYRQMSYDLEQIALPDDWEMSYTKTGERYFLNHKEKTTTWEDPRKMLMEEMLRRNSGVPLVPPVAATVVATPAPPIQQPIIQQSPIIQPNTGSMQHQQQLSDIDITGVPLPDGWEMSRNEAGDLYFISHRDETTSWFHPSVPRNLQLKRVQAYQQCAVAQLPPPFVNNRVAPSTTAAASPTVATNDLVAALRNMNTSGQQQPAASAPSSLSGSQQNLRDLELERERMRQRQEEILQSSLLSSVGASHLLLGSSQASSAAAASDLQQQLSLQQHSPFMLQANECHSRQESSDSGLDLGMSGGGGGSSNASYSMPHTPEDFLRITGPGAGTSLLNGNATTTSASTATSMVTTSGAANLADALGFDSMLDLETETMEFMNMEMDNIDNMDLLTNVEEILNSNKDNIMTWL